MKRTILALIAATLTLSACAQLSFKVEIPEFSKFIVVTAENVNLRKAPDAQSAKLMQWDSDAGSSETQMYPVFSDEDLKPLQKEYYNDGYLYALHPSVGEIMPVLSESGEWSKVWYTCAMSNDYPYHRSREAYMMSKFGVTFELKEGISLSDLEKIGNMSFTPCKARRYSDISYAVSCELTDYGENFVHIHIAMMINDIYLRISGLDFCRLVEEDVPQAQFTEVEMYDDYEGEMRLYKAVKTHFGGDAELAERNIREAIDSLPESEFVAFLNEFGLLENTVALLAMTSAGEIANIPDSFGDEEQAKAYIKTIKVSL